MKIANFLAIVILNKEFKKTLKIKEIVGMRVDQDVKIFEDDRDKERVQQYERHTSAVSKEGRSASREERTRLLQNFFRS